MMKSGLEKNVLKFHEPLQSWCFPVQKNLPRNAELTWLVSRYLWSQKSSLPIFVTYPLAWNSILQTLHLMLCLLNLRWRDHIEKIKKVFCSFYSNLEVWYQIFSNFRLSTHFYQLTIEFLPNMWNKSVWGMRSRDYLRK